MATPKPKKKLKTLDDFAAYVHNDYLAVSNNMATKQEMNLKFKDVHGALRDIREDVKNLNNAMVSKADLANTLREELDKSPYAKERDVAELRERVGRVEERLGMKPSRHAA